MSFADSVNSLLGACLNTFGQAVSFTDSNLVTHELTGIFSNEYESVDPETGYPVVSSIPNLGVRLADWPKTPDEGEIIFVQGENFRVRHVEADGEGGAVIILTRDN